MLRRVILASLLIGSLALSASFNQSAFAQNDDPLAHLKVPTNSVRFNNPKAGKVEDFLLHSPFFAQLAQKLVGEMEIGRLTCQYDVWRNAKEQLAALVKRAESTLNDFNRQRNENERDDVSNPTLAVLLPRAEHDVIALRQIANRAPRYDFKHCGDPDQIAAASEAVKEVEENDDPQYFKRCESEDIDEDIDDLETSLKKIRDKLRTTTDPEARAILDEGEEKGEEKLKTLRRMSKQKKLEEQDLRKLDPLPGIHGCAPRKVPTGFYLGGQLVKNSGRVRTTETFAATGQTTFQSTDSGDPLGVGIVAGYNFRPWNNNIVLGPFASFDFLNQTINHSFVGGQFLGTTTHWIMTVGAKGGYVVTPGLYLYGLAGASWLNQSLNVNFATAASSNTTTPGFTLGFGGEYQPASWRLFGKPVSVFLQYQHTWWGTANFNTPASSPFFNYAFKREDDTIKLGVNVHLSR